MFVSTLGIQLCKSLNSGLRLHLTSVLSSTVSWFYNSNIFNV